MVQLVNVLLAMDNAHTGPWTVNQSKDGLKQVYRPNLLTRSETLSVAYMTAYLLDVQLGINLISYRQLLLKRANRHVIPLSFVIHRFTVIATMYIYISRSCGIIGQFGVFSKQ